VARAGAATVFPQAVGMAASFDEELMGAAASCIAEEGRAKYNEFSAHNDRDIYKGLTFWSPNVNIFRDPRWGRGHEKIPFKRFASRRIWPGKFVKTVDGAGVQMTVLQSVHRRCFLGE